jgi:hypothetical protein
MTCEEVITGLRSLEAEHFEEEVPDYLHMLMGVLKELPSRERAIPEIFALMERLPDSDLGWPGPLGHALERMNYTDELVASIRRRPTVLAILMVNRILNTDLPPERRQFYLDLLASVDGHPEANAAAREQARQFIEVQKGRNG